jgi:thiol-disulfide isomerase/thioredoxin
MLKRWVAVVVLVSACGREGVPAVDAGVAGSGLPPVAEVVEPRADAPEVGPPNLGDAAAPANDAAATGVDSVTVPEASTPAGAIAVERFEGSALDAMVWNPGSDRYRVGAGDVVADGVENHPLWLRRPLPCDVRIAFTAWAETLAGDLKFEVMGDGAPAGGAPPSIAGGPYRPSGYVFIMGGWGNTTSVIARGDERDGRLAVERRTRVVPGRRYQMVIEIEGGELRWFIDGIAFLRALDPSPRCAPGHASFGFSGWQSRVHFDDLVVTPLPASAVRGCAGLEPEFAPSGARLPFARLPEGIGGRDAAGDRLALDTLRGRPLVLHLSAPWCGSCAEDAAKFAALSTRLGGDAVFVVLTPEPLAKEVAQGGALTVLIDAPEAGSGGPGALGPVAGRLGVTRVPETFLVDAAGDLRWYFPGPRDWGSADAEACVRSLGAAR